VVVGNIRERLHLAEGRDREGPDHKGSQGQSQTFLAHFVSPYQWSWIFRYFCSRLVRAVTERISVFRTVSVPVSSPGRGIPSVDLHERLPPKAPGRRRVVRPDGAPPFLRPVVMGKAWGWKEAEKP